MKAMPEAVRIQGRRFSVPALLLLACCGGSSNSRVERLLDGAPEAGDRDGGTPVPDAEATQSEKDAESERVDAAVDAGALSLRDQVCGDITSWPAALPAAMNAREAKPVGSDTFGFIEGPVWIAEQGVLLFSDMNFGGGDAMGPPAKIRRLKPPATFDEFSASSNGNGLALSREGSLLAATHDNQALSVFDLTTAVRTKISVLTGGKHFNSPNDLTVRSDGTVYLTDPDWQLGARNSETKITGVYRVPPPLSISGSNSAVLVDGTLDKPNGIALSPDERTLYVGSSGSEIWKYPVKEDGALGMRSKFADTGGSDGFAVDCAGNLYVTSDTVEVFAPSGTKLGDITLADTPSNAAFGGADRKTLYITAGSRLYSIRLNVPGFPY